MLGRPLAEWLAVALVCAGCAGLATWHGWLWRLDQALYDAAIAARPRNADADVAIVAIDDRSLAEIGRWPWPRAVHAALVERLAAAGARAIAFDLILNERDPADAAGDLALARAIAAHGRVVLPVIHALDGAFSSGEAGPAPLFADAAAALGHIQIELDPDGIARTIYLWEGMDAPRHPQLGLALLEVVDPQRAAAYPRPLRPAATAWQRAEWLHIPYLGPPGSFRYLSYVDVLRGNVPPASLKDTIVFVGVSAAGMGDVVPTPTSGSTRSMPGVEVNANVFSALRNGEAIRPVAAEHVALGAAVIVLLLLAVMARAGARFTLVAAFGFGLAVPLASALALGFAHLWLPPAGALAGCMLAYPLWSWRRLEAAQRYLDTELAALLADGDGLAAVAPLSHAAPPAAIDRFQARLAAVREVARRERALQRFVADTLEGVPVGVVVIDGAGGVLLANRPACELCGSDDRAQLRERLAALPWPPEVPLADGLPDPVAAGGLIAVEMDPAEGPALLVSARALYDADGGRRGTVVGLADISAVRAAQRSRDEAMDFLSHDLRAPLASILTLVDARRNEEGRDGGADAVESRIARYARSALALADNLVRLVRADAIDPASFTDLAPEMLAADAADEVWALARDKGVRLVTDLGAADDPDEGGAVPPTVRGDGDLLRRALVNLLSNAIKYTPSGGEVRIALAAVPGGWAFVVSDTGIGIAPQHLPQLFQRFGRLPTSANRRVGGVGLGLRMVQAVAHRHGGSIDVASRPGAGSTFTLRLPAGGGEAATPGTGAKRA